MSGVALTPEERHVMEHAVAWKHPTNPGYRNRYSADARSDTWPTIQALVGRGLMELGNPAAVSLDVGVTATFLVTPAGLAALGPPAKCVGPTTAWFHASCRDQDTGWPGPFDTREAAIADGRAVYDHDFVVAEAAKLDPAEFMMSADQIVDEMSERADELAEWPRVSDEAKEELDALLTAWARKHCSAGAWELSRAVEQVAHAAKEAP